MGELKMAQNQMNGLLSGIFGNLPQGFQGITPQLQQKDIVIELTEQQFMNIALQQTPPEAKNAISIKFSEGKMTIRVKLV